MLGRRRRRVGTDHVTPDLPITPMLDMSFQLLAFFIMTFKPAPTEGHIAMTLPKDEGGGAGIPNLLDENKPLHYIVRVTATKEGKIEKITLREEGNADPKTTECGAEVEKYQAELKAIAAKLEKEKKTGKLTLELGDDLVHDYVVQLMDVAIRAGFTDIAPVPIPQKQ